MTALAPLGRRAAVEAVGTAVLVAVVVGSGIQATQLSPDVGVQLLANSPGRARPAARRPGGPRRWAEPPRRCRVRRRPGATTTAG